MKRYATVPSFFLTLILLLSACRNIVIDDFESCAAAGNPVMESYPRQCAYGGVTYREIIRHVCTEDESKQTACTKEYMPVCGEIILNAGNTIFQTFPNRCTACASMKVVAYSPGNCIDNGIMYLSRSQEECSRMGVWQCDEGASLFSDETGCGCKK